MASAPVILGITKRFAWLVLPDSFETDSLETGIVSVPSMQRLFELALRLRSVTDVETCSAGHLLLRFNLLNLSDAAISVCAIGLRSRSQETLRCELVPHVAIGEGARYPFGVEVKSQLGSAAVEVHLQLGDEDRLWIPVADLPQ